MHALAHLDIQAWTPTAKRRPEGAEMPAARLLYDLIDVWARLLSEARVSPCDGGKRIISGAKFGAYLRSWHDEVGHPPDTLLK